MAKCYLIKHFIVYTDFMYIIDNATNKIKMYKYKMRIELMSLNVLII